MHAKRLAVLGLVLASCAAIAVAQDRRTVTEPVIPSACASISATKVWSNGALPASEESKLDTAAIQQAIDSCPSGQSVRLTRAGQQNALLTGPLVLKSGVTLVVERGVTLVASRDPALYDLKGPGTCGTLAQKYTPCKPLIAATKADGSGVMGEGVIEGRGGSKLLGHDVSWWELADQARTQHNHQTCPRLIQTEGTNNFTLYQITLRNAPNFHVVFNTGIGFTAWGVHIDSPLNARNTDGIDPGGATDVTITQSWFRSGDDDIAIKAAKGQPSSHITIAHNHFLGGHGVTIGSETEAGVTAVRVTDLTIEHNELGLTLRSNPLHGGLVQDVVYDDVCIRDTHQPIWFSTVYTDSNTSADKFSDQSNYAHFTNITLRNVRAEGGEQIVMNGIASQLRTDVILDGVSLSPALKQKLAHVHLTLGPGPVDFSPKGEDIVTDGAAGKGKLLPCKNRWVSWPSDAK